jgi:hypothetical protein
MTEKTVNDFLKDKRDFATANRVASACSIGGEYAA